MTADRLLMWAPRILGIGMALFLALFALDALGPGKPWLGFVIHLLPTFVVLAVVAASWHRGWIGGIAFIALAVFYATQVPDRPDWILVIAGPLVVVGILFLWSWVHLARSAQ